MKYVSKIIIKNEAGNIIEEKLLPNPALSERDARLLLSTQMEVFERQHGKGNVSGSLEEKQ